MPDYKYLIVGGGMTADAAVGGIREVDAEASIGVLAAETSPPYKRPPLTKGLWKGEPESEIWLENAKKNADLKLGCSARALDPGKKTVTDAAGVAHSYERLLLATGGTPRRLPFGGDLVLYYRTFDGYRRLRELAGTGERFAVIGGGFIGAEIAAALAMNGKQVTMIFPGASVGGRLFPEDLGAFVNARYREKGVRLLSGDEAVAAERRAGGVRLTTKAGDAVDADGIVAGIGIAPNTDLAAAAGIEVADGIVVDAHCATSAPGVYAAGDVAAFRNAALGKRLRVEHEDNANTMGRIAGRNLAGANDAYDHLPFFYSDLFEFGYEAVGEVDSRHRTFADWKEPYREGVVYYLADGRVRGALLWNVWNRVDAARELIAAKGPFRPEDLKGRLSP